MPPRQRGRRHRHRRHDQDDEGILDAARQIEQRHELQRVVGKERGGEIGCQAVPAGKAQAQKHVDPGRNRYEEQAVADGELEAEDEIDYRHCQELPDETEPPEADDGLEAQPAFDRLTRAVSKIEETLGHDAPAQGDVRATGSALRQLPACAAPPTCPNRSQHSARRARWRASIFPGQLHATCNGRNA